MMTQAVVVVAVGVVLVLAVEGRPQDSTLVVSAPDEKEPGEECDLGPGSCDPVISRFHVVSNIQFRYAQTLVKSYVKNPSSSSQEVSFTAVIPDSAFISNFSMIIDDKEYVAEVKTKEEAKDVYEEAVDRGRGSGIVSQDVRNSNKFTVAANVEAGKKVEFILTYEELLERKLGKYEHVINVNPGQIVDDFKIEVFINESLPIKSLNVPELKESNDLDFEPGQESEIAVVERNVDGDDSKAHVMFEPDKIYQEEAGDQGLSGQFLVQYEVDRQGKESEVQVIDGYFVHYFTPENLPTLPKYVIFVLDVSGSMGGEKIDQLKDAMFTILDDMTDRDYFNIITFSSSVNHWQPPSEDDQEEITRPLTDYEQFVEQLEAAFPSLDGIEVIQATDENRAAAIQHVLSLSAQGGTNINDALKDGLTIAYNAQQNETLPEDVQSILVFLSDGQPSVGITDGDTISSNVRENNTLKVPIYSLGFGRDADFDLIREISADAGAFSKQIYEGSDAVLQLEDFFTQISSPLLSNLKFDYVGRLVDNSSVSKPELQTFFKGGEYIVTGKLKTLPAVDDDILEVIVDGESENNSRFTERLLICLRPIPILNPIEDQPISGPIDGEELTVSNTTIEEYEDSLPIPHHPGVCVPPPPPPPRSQAQNFLQKLHAFLNIKQLLKNQEEVSGDNTDEESNKAKALQLSLDNNFVTDLTSLVVVRPDEDSKIVSLSATDGHSDGGGAFPFALRSQAGSGGFSAGFSAAAPARVGVSNFFKSSRPRPSLSRPSLSSPPVRQKNKVSAPRPPLSKVPTSTFALSDDYYDLSPESIESESDSESPISCSGNITIFSRNYLRGDSVVLTEDTEDLAKFNNKLTSVLVEGDCCWAVFTGKKYGGESETFWRDQSNEGKFRSVVTVGKVLRQAQSVKTTKC